MGRWISFGLIAIAAAGCAREVMMTDTTIRRTAENRPAWTYTPPPPSNGKAFFVGRSLAVNVLDEQHAMNEAMDDAIYQIARSAGAEVTGNARYVDHRSGEAIRGTERTEQPSDEEVRVDVNGTVIGVRQEDTFFEKFSVRDKSLGDKYQRYKYYVLVSVPQTELDELANQVKKKARYR